MSSHKRQWPSGSINEELKIAIGDAQYFLVPNKEVVLYYLTRALTRVGLIHPLLNVPFPTLQSRADFCRTSFKISISKTMQPPSYLCMQLPPARRSPNRLSVSFVPVPSNTMTYFKPNSIEMPVSTEARKKTFVSSPMRSTNWLCGM